MPRAIAQLFAAGPTIARHRRNKLSLERVASDQSRRGLDWMNFFIADVQEGFGALRVRRQGLDRHHQRPRAGQFVLHATALPGNPYDGHTLGSVIEATEKLTGCPIERAYVDKGYRGHKTENPRRVFISGQKRGVFGVIER